MSSVIETLDRRSFLGRSLWGLGASALSHLMPDYLLADQTQPSGLKARAKRVIYLFMSGAPSQLDLYDHKPGMEKWFDRDLPDSVRKGQRLTTMTSGQSRFPIAPTKYAFKRHGQAGAELSELLPHTSRVVDHLAIVRSVHTDAINHDPAITMIQTGDQRPGKPSLGAPGGRLQAPLVLGGARGRQVVRPDGHWGATVPFGGRC